MVVQQACTSCSCSMNGSWKEKTWKYSGVKRAIFSHHFYGCRILSLTSLLELLLKLLMLVLLQVLPEFELRTQRFGNDPDDGYSL